jgi:hypothetical protein
MGKMYRVICSCTLLLALSLGSVQAKNWFIYDLDGSQLPHTLCDSLVNVKLEQSDDTLLINDFPSLVPGLVDDYTPMTTQEFQSFVGRTFHRLGRRVPGVVHVEPELSQICAAFSERSRNSARIAA